jgi:tetratricopeptide (TPR) repeat protein
MRDYLSEHPNLAKALLLVLVVVLGLVFLSFNGPRSSNPDLAPLETLLQNKNYSGAETLALEMEKQYPNNAQIELIQGEAEFSLNKYDDALSAFNQVLVIDPSNQTALYYKGIIPKVQSIIAQPMPISSSVPAGNIEARFGVTFDHTILQPVSAYSFSSATGTVESMDATYDSTESISSVAAYFQKILPQPVIIVTDGPVVEFFGGATTIASSTYFVRIGTQNSETVVSIIHT